MHSNNYIFYYVTFWKQSKIDRITHQVALYGQKKKEWKEWSTEAPRKATFKGNLSPPPTLTGTNFEGWRRSTAILYLPLQIPWGVPEGCQDQWYWKQHDVFPRPMLAIVHQVWLTVSGLCCALNSEWKRSRELVSSRPLWSYKMATFSATFF